MIAAIGRFLASGLVKVWAIIGGTVLQFLWDKLSAAVAAWKAKREIEAKARAEREATEQAQTEEERKRAADDSRRL